MNSDVTAAGFRDFMEWNGAGSTAGRKSDTNLGLLLNAASDELERLSGRLITSSASNTVRTFTTHGRGYVVIPDLRAGTATLQDTALDEGETFWLVPSRQSPDIYVAVQLHAFGKSSYLANPNWFDRNLDVYGPDTSLPNDLVITGLWGWTTTPYSWRLGIYALAGYYYQHADALFSGARATPEGNIFDLSRYPSEVQSLIESWRIGDQASLA